MTRHNYVDIVSKKEKFAKYVGLIETKSNIFFPFENKKVNC